jgi:uncharacterized membrane protein YgdD (TMEM256/DUF423 family)
MRTTHSSPRWPAVAGALLAGAAVALSAYASHAVEGEARARLLYAAAFAFGHGVALQALAPRGRLGTVPAWMLLAGTLLFSGALAGKTFFGWSSAPAPWGGTLLIAGWLLQAVAAWRR